jgi:hypothetical protein
MMGRLKSDHQGQLFYEFHLGDAVPEDHLVRKIDTALDLSWLRGELASHYSSMGRPPRASSSRRLFLSDWEGGVESRAARSSERARCKGTVLLLIRRHEGLRS